MPGFMFGRIAVPALMASRHQAIVGKINRRLARAITALIGAVGFETVRVKRSGSRKASIRVTKSPAGEKTTPVTYAGASVRPDRFFSVDVAAEAGINHLKSALSLLIKESVSLNRTPLVFTPRFESAHNRGHKVASSWDKYIDLSRIAIVKHGATHHVEAFGRDVIADLESCAVLEVNGRHLVTAAENAQYDLIVKNNPSGLGNDNVYGHDDFDFDVRFCP